MGERIVVGGAVIADGRLLIAQRCRPPELAGRWELPGGKVSAGESDADALVRELDEELGVTVAVGRQLAGEVALSEDTVLRAYLATLLDGVPEPRDHRALRWVTTAELDAVDWVPADRLWVPELAGVLTSCGRA
jgi:8-oxo-dGTP diphosphatase